MREREYRLILCRSMEAYRDGDYGVSEYHDTLSAARSAARFARTELAEQGFIVLIETQEVEMENGEAVEHYGWSRVVG